MVVILTRMMKMMMTGMMMIKMITMVHEARRSGTAPASLSLTRAPTWKKGEQEGGGEADFQEIKEIVKEQRKVWAPLQLTRSKIKTKRGRSPVQLRGRRQHKLGCRVFSCRTWKTITIITLCVITLTVITIIFPTLPSALTKEQCQELAQELSSLLLFGRFPDQVWYIMIIFLTVMHRKDISSVRRHMSLYI